MEFIGTKAIRPQGQLTRGKTARNRLRRVDNFLMMYDPGLVRWEPGRGMSAYFVDLGYGAEPYTALESAERLRKLNPKLPILGVEIAQDRVDRAAVFSDQLTKFRLGGFNLPLANGEGVKIVRAFNVLRQYQEYEYQASMEVLSHFLMEGALVLEGTSDPLGRVWVSNLWRKKQGQLFSEGLLFSTNFRWGFEPGIFQPVLPKNHIHHMFPGEDIYHFMQAWKEAANLTMGFKVYGLRQWFVNSAKALAGMGFSLDLRDRFLNRGFLIYKGKCH
jgi:hypothetical protein